MLTPLERELLSALREALPLLGWRDYSDDDLLQEVRLGNGFARTILAARAVIAKAEAKERETAHLCALDPVAIATAEAGYMRHSDLVDMAVEADVPLGLR